MKKASGSSKKLHLPKEIIIVIANSYIALFQVLGTTPVILWVNLVPNNPMRQVLYYSQYADEITNA